MVARPWDQRNTTLRRDYVHCLAKDIGWYCGLLTRVEWAGSETASSTYVLPGVNTRQLWQQKDLPLPMEAWLRFLGIYLAEGTMITNYKEHRIQIAAVKPRERSFVIEALRGIGIETSPNTPDRFAFSSRRTYEAMMTLGLCGVHAPFKFVPSFVFEQSAANIREFLLGHFTGDGTECQNGMHRHYTSSKQLAEDLQRLIFLAGDESYIRSREPRLATLKDGRKISGRFLEYCVSACEQRSSSLDRKEHVTEEQYVGEVFCAEVPSRQALVTRRQGCILVSGSC
jgi:hypothetical protein